MSDKCDRPGCPFQWVAIRLGTSERLCQSHWRSSYRLPENYGQLPAIPVHDVMRDINRDIMNRAIARTRGY